MTRRVLFYFALDAFISPYEDAVLIQTEDQLLLYPRNGQNIQSEPAWQLELKDKEAVIMVKWLTGEQKEKWDEQIQNVFLTKNFRYPGYNDKSVYVPR